MKTIGLSPLEIRGIVEQAFLPLACTCERFDEDAFTIRIEDLHNGRLMLLAHDISADRFASSRDISVLIAELRARLEDARNFQHPQFHHQLSQHAHWL